MSQNRDIDFGSDDGAKPLDVARILAGLEPEPLRIERDELFYQAGLAAASSSLSPGERAGVRGLNSLRFWQATAAALLVACIGLSATAFRQGMISASDSSSGISTGATAGLSSSGSARGADINDRFLTDPRTRKWQQLASADWLPPGRLTALGWSELSSEELAARGRASAESPQESDASPTSSRLTPELLKSLHLPHEG